MTTAWFLKVEAVIQVLQNKGIHLLYADWVTPGVALALTYVHSGKDGSREAGLNVSKEKLISIIVLLSSWWRMLAKSK